MRRSRSESAPSEKQLGILAMRFRGTRDEKERCAIAESYARIVEGLIGIGTWNEIPALEDQLPDECMPEAFFQHWSLTPPAGCPAQRLG